jgi:REP-associated tyrosine transposase
MRHRDTQSRETEHHTFCVATALPVPSGTKDRSPPRKRWGVGCDSIKPRRGDTVAHSFSQNHVHLIFSTKDRRNSISKEWQPRLWAYLVGICRNHEMIALDVGGTENHVHILFHLPPKLALAKAVLLLKANSSKWMSEQGRDFSWQEDYVAFSVSSSNLDQVTRYIQNQEAHHRKTSFEDEFRALLRKHGVDDDFKYVFG